MNTSRKLLFIFFTAIGLTLAGCGGGGGTSATATPAVSTVSGTVATGAPLAGATVTVTGANGVTATTATGAGGTYSVNGTFTYPVLLKATQAASTVTLYSAVTAAGTANITPLTNLALMLNTALPDDLSTVENTWVATHAAMLTKANMRAAQAIVNANFSAQMIAAGLTPTVYDFLTTPITIGTGIDSVMDGLLFTFDHVAGTFAITLSDTTTPVTFNLAIGTTGITIGELSAPTGVQAVAGNHQVTISWNPVAGATAYNLYMAQQPDVPKDPAIMHHSTTATSITPHTDLTNGIPYYFMVTALNASGESIASAEVSAIPAVPPAPVAHTFSYFKRNGTAIPQTATLLTDGTLNIDGKVITGVSYSVVGTCLSGGNGTALTACFSPFDAPHTMLLCGPDPVTSAADTLLYVLFDSPDTNRISATSTALLNALQSETNFLGTGVYTDCSGSFSTSWIRNAPLTNYYLWPDVFTTYTSTHVSDLLIGAVIYSTPTAGVNYNEYVAVRVSGAVFEVWH